MSGIDVASLMPTLKEVYEPVINETMNKSTFLLEQIETDNSGIQGSTSGGRYKVQALKIDQAVSAGSRDEGQLLPEPGSPKYEKATIDLTTLAANVGVTGESEARSDADEKAISTDVTNAVKEATEAAKRDMNRKVYKTEAGNLFQIEVDSGTGTPADPWVLSYSDPQVSKNRWIARQERINFGTVTNGEASVNIQNVAEVTAIDPKNKKFKAISVNGTPTPTDGDWVFGEGSVNNALAGLDQAIGDDTLAFQGLDPNVLGEDWKPVLSDAANASISADLLDEFLEEASVTSGSNYLDGESALILTDRGQARNLWADMEDNLRFNDSTDVKPKGKNYGTITLPTGHVVTHTPEAPAGQVQLINKDHMKLISAKGDWHFMQGKPFHNWSRRNTKEVVLVRYCQLAITKRNCHGRISNLRA